MDKKEYIYNRYCKEGKRELRWFTGYNFFDKKYRSQPFSDFYSIPDGIEGISKRKKI